MSSIKSVCVFSGASPNVPQIYLDAARKLGHLFVKANIDLIYGGGNYGLCGEISNGVMERGGRVIGFLPEDLLPIEGGNTKITQLTIVPDMHERKKNMFKYSDAFVVLPGGFGTFEEIFGVLTWKKIGFHSKPIIILDIKDYWKCFKDLLAQIVKEGFAGENTEDLYYIANTVEDVMSLLCGDKR